MKKTLLQQLMENGHAFSFFQAVRLLKKMPADTGPSSKAAGAMAEKVVVRPDLSFGFPAADIHSVEKMDDARFRINATFFGLYGASSPLPTFYTEDLLDEAQSDESVSRDFLDIVHQRLYELLFDGWRKYRLFQQVAEDADPISLTRLFCFLGLGEPGLREHIREPMALIRYAGLFTQHPRSIMGLQTLLRDALGINRVTVLPNIWRWAQLPEDQRLSLGSHGNCIGVQAILGQQVPDRMGKFRIRIGPLKEAAFRSFFPGEANYRKLVSLVGLYLKDSLTYDIEAIWAAGEIKTTCLGNRSWAMLGLDTWLSSEDISSEERTIFYPE